MKKMKFLMLLSLFLIIAGCDSQKEYNGLSLPFSASEVEIIELIHHTGDPSNAEQKWVDNSEDIVYIYNMLSSEILIGSGSVDDSAQTDTLYITFHNYDGTGYTVKFENYGVKKGIIIANNSPGLTYFTPADVCWIWGQLAKKYVGQPISISEDPYATEKPVAVGSDS